MSLFIDALIDTSKLLPLLVGVYFLVSFFEYRYGNRMGFLLTHINRYGPVIGALFGCIPQCGFSVVASALYVKRLISVGTLLSVFLSTSDEAIPILLSIPCKAHFVADLIVIKVIIAVLAGLTVDFVIKLRNARVVSDVSSADVSLEDAIKGHEGCCAHDVDEKRSTIKSLLIHPLLHTVKVFLFLLAFSLVLNIIVNKVGDARISRLLLSGSILQPFLAAVIGLIPNCFSSVLLAGLFVKGVISFGSLIAGLCAGAGLGMLVLLKENKSFKDTIFIIALLIGVSILAGVLIQFSGIIF
jgi:hypothetical protein